MLIELDTLDKANNTKQTVINTKDNKINELSKENTENSLRMNKLLAELEIEKQKIMNLMPLESSYFQ